jgi:hypothetical protein
MNLTTLARKDKDLQRTLSLITFMHGKRYR